MEAYLITSTNGILNCSRTKSNIIIEMVLVLQTYIYICSQSVLKFHNLFSDFWFGQKIQSHFTIQKCTHYIPFVDQHDLNHYSEAKHNPGTMQTIFISQTITTNDITAKPITTQQNTFTATHKAVITIKHNTHDLSNSLHITRIHMNIDWNWKGRLLNRLTVYEMKNGYPLIWLISIMVAIINAQITIRGHK